MVAFVAPDVVGNTVVGAAATALPTIDDIAAVSHSALASRRVGVRMNQCSEAILVGVIDVEAVPVLDGFGCASATAVVLSGAADALWGIGGGHWTVSALTTKPNRCHKKCGIEV